MTAQGYHSTETWARWADEFQRVADQRRIAEINWRDERRACRRGAFAGGAAAIVLAAVGLALNYMTGGTPLW